MKVHDLKIRPKYFEAVCSGHKTFEYGFNDRNLEEGDSVLLREYVKVTDKFTGRRMGFKVGYVLPIFDNKFCIFSLLPL